MQYHCLSSYRNDFVSKRLVLLSHFDCKFSVLQLDFPKTHPCLSFLVPRMVVLDPTLTRILLNKNEDIAFLPWDQLFERYLSLVLSTVDPRFQLIPICIVHRRRLQLDSTSGQVTVASLVARVRLLQIAIFVFNRHACYVTATNNPFLLVCMSLCFPCLRIFSSSRILYVYFLVPSFIC